MTIFIIVVGVSLIVMGIYGVVSSRIESRDYKNSTDIQKISKVTAEIYGTKTFLPENQKPFTKIIKKKLTLQRARNLKKRKTDGDFLLKKNVRVAEQTSCPMKTDAVLIAVIPFTKIAYSGK